MINSLKNRIVFIACLLVTQAILVYLGAWAGVFLFTHGKYFSGQSGLLSFPHVMTNWDSGWYASIAAKGYSWNGNINLEQNVAFFPLYPIFMKLSSLIFGGRSYLALIAPAYFIGALSIIAFFFLSLLELPENKARFATITYALYPGSMWFFTGYPVSLINLFIILALIALLKNRRFMPYVISGFGTSAGPTVVFFSFSIFMYELWRMLFKSDIFSRGARHIFREFSVLTLKGILSLSGILLFMLYLYFKFGDPLAFVHAQDAWGAYPAKERLINSINFNVFHINYFRELFHSFLFKKTSTGQKLHLEFYFLINDLFLILIAFGTFIALKKERYNYFLYGVVSILMYFWFFGSTIGPYNGVRLLYAVIPVFIMLGYTYSENKYFPLCLVLTSALSLVFLTALEAAGYPVI